MENQRSRNIKRDTWKIRKKKVKILKITKLRNTERTRFKITKLREMCYIENIYDQSMQIERLQIYMKNKRKMHRDRWKIKKKIQIYRYILRDRSERHESKLQINK